MTTTTSNINVPIPADLGLGLQQANQSPAIGLLNQLEIRPQNEHTAVASSTGPAAAPAAPVTPAAKEGELNSSPQPTPEVKTFNFGGKQIRMVMSKDSQPLFCLSDICDGCGISDRSNAKKALNSEYQGGVNLTHPFQTAGGVQHLRVITEEQMYFIIMRGRNEIAKQFRHWICSEVIPSIRRTGSYSIHMQVPERKDDGRFDISYPKVAAEFTNQLHLQGEALAVFNWIIERARQQGIAIGVGIGSEKEKERRAHEQAQEARLIEADNQKMLQLKKDVDFFKAEAERFQKLDSLKGGALSVLVQYPNDFVVRTLAKQILGLNQDQN